MNRELLASPQKAIEQHKSRQHQAETRPLKPHSVSPSEARISSVITVATTPFCLSLLSFIHLYL